MLLAGVLDPLLFAAFVLPAALSFAAGFRLIAGKVADRERLIAEALLGLCFALAFEVGFFFVLLGVARFFDFGVRLPAPLPGVAFPLNRSQRC